MSSIMKKVNGIYKDQKMNTKQEENWISIDEIKTKYDALHLDAISMLNKKKTYMHVRCTYGCMYVQYKTTLPLPSKNRN